VWVAEQHPVPKAIGRYQVLGTIGIGAMGAVYKAFDPLIKRTLAIKTIRLDIARGSPEYKQFLDRFYHEARISGTLAHPSIVTLFDIGEDVAGLPYLAMEFIEGETLESMVERGVRFRPEKVIGLASQVAAALDYAHQRGVVHRDIKPANLILFERDRVKVMDFGIAKLAGSELTQAGQLLGTPSYMSPEQALGEKLDGRSDIFSLGVVCFEMLSGEQPFSGNNVTSILYRLVHMPPAEPQNLELNGLVPQKWQEVFSKALAKKPDQRYQTAAEFVQDLELCLGSWFSALPGGIDDDGADPGARTMLDDEGFGAALPVPLLHGVVPVAPPPARFDSLTEASGESAAEDEDTLSTIRDLLGLEDHATGGVIVERLLALLPKSCWTYSHRGWYRSIVGSPKRVAQVYRYNDREQWRRSTYLHGEHADRYASAFEAMKAADAGP